MANPLVNLLDRDSPAKKLQKEIEAMEFKKQSLLTTIQGDINATKQKITVELQQIGLVVYNNHINGVADAIDHTAYFNEIKALNSICDEKSAKLKEVADRYNEEISMLKANLASMQPQSAQPTYSAPANSGVACPKCRKPYTLGVDVFCKSCGQKLPTPTPEPAPADSYGENAVAYCGNCGKPYTVGVDAFCVHCGQKPD